jgi:hypothetical protein
MLISPGGITPIKAAVKPIIKLKSMAILLCEDTVFFKKKNQNVCM